MFLDATNADQCLDSMQFSTAGTKELITITASNCHSVRIPSITALGSLHQIARLHETCEKLLSFKTLHDLFFFFLAGQQKLPYKFVCQGSKQVTQLKAAHPRIIHSC